MQRLLMVLTYCNRVGLDGTASLCSFEHQHSHSVDHYALHDNLLAMRAEVTTCNAGHIEMLDSLDAAAALSAEMASRGQKLAQAVYTNARICRLACPSARRYVQYVRFQVHHALILQHASTQLLQTHETTLQ